MIACWFGKSNQQEQQVLNTTFDKIIRIIIIIIIIIYSEFFTSALADGLSLVFEWQQVSSSLPDSS